MLLDHIRCHTHHEARAHVGSRLQERPDGAPPTHVREDLEPVRYAYPFELFITDALTLPYVTAATPL